MKKLLLGSIVLSVFALSVTLVQMSCSKSQASPLDNPQLGKIVYFTEYASPTTRLWIANYDGTNATIVPLVLPTNVVFDPTVNTQTLRVSPNGQTIFFSAFNTTQPTLKTSIYSCDASGNNVRLVVTSTSSSVFLGQAY